MPAEINEHAELAPSSADRWVPCPGSASLERLYPEDTEGVEAREGTAAHWFLAESLHGRMIAEGQIAPNGFISSAEMVEIVEACAEYVDALGLASLHIEETLTTPIHHKVWGTPDLWGFEVKPTMGPHLHVADFKYGHDVVEVFENRQLICYASGVLQTLDAAFKARLRVTFHILQPRSYHRTGPYRTWTTSAARIEKLAESIALSAEEADGQFATTIAGKHCRHCKARHACATLQAAGFGVMDYVGNNVPFDLTPAALGVELRYLQRAKAMLLARETALEAQATSMIKRGERVPWFALVPSAGREKWSVDDSKVIITGKLLGVNLAAPVKAITPAQARNSGMPASIIRSLASRDNGSHKLEEIDDKEARRIFSN